jgi:phenylacetic acid degradation operon negative regulatory protein
VASLSARSIVASTLLGTVPPRLPGRLLVAFAQEFGVQAGTTRVALSRMVDGGELIRVEGGSYKLAGTLLERHQRQEDGLRPSTRQWGGEWELRIVPAGARSSAERAALRRSCLHLGLRERRDGVWMRPDNLPPDRLPGARAVVDEQTERLVAVPELDSIVLVAELFELDVWATEARRLCDVLDAVGTESSLARGFEVAADSLRHIVADPLLPEALWPSGWPAATLRSAYAAYLVGYQTRLSGFFRAELAAVQ